MSDLTFSEYAKTINMPRTTLYTKLNQLKKTDPARYEMYVIQNEDTLKIRHEKMDELKGFLQAEHKPVNKTQIEQQKQLEQQRHDEIEVLKKALNQSEERYQLLLEQYIAQTNQVKEMSERLLCLLEKQNDPSPQEVSGTNYHDDMIESRVVNRSKIVLEEHDEEPQTDSGLLNRIFNK